MAGPHLIYFADPMCSWCWGFAPVIEEIAARFGERLPISLVLGGLRPGTTVPMQQKHMLKLRAHWAHVREASGQEFDDAFFARTDFIYDTEPPCRAVVIFRRRNMKVALRGLKRLQQAFYAQNKDITSAAILTELAAEFDFDAGEFTNLLNDAGVREECWRDFAITQNTGIRGFPALIAGTGRNDEYAVVTNGYVSADVLMPGLIRWADQYL